ncbi:MAG: LCP family protein [Oscillospiraceae bacterium]|nr:LCP family protein [Oscillospiraceae bacterium]
MADNNDDALYDIEADEDLLTTIRRWTEKAQSENEARRAQWPAQEGAPAYLRNPWAPELAAAADRALREDPQQRQEAPSAARIEEGPKAASRMKRKHPARRVIAVLLALVLLLGAGGYALAFAMAGKVDARPLSDADRAALFAVTGTTRVTNILLLGVDTEEGGRTDTMLLLSIDRVHRKLKLTSFLRDSWLPLLDSKTNKLGKEGRLNTAIHAGGPAAVMRTISDRENFNVRVDHYVMFNFEIFEKIVDALGGVAVPITKKEAAWLYQTAGAFKRMEGKDGLEEMRRQMQNWEPNTSGTVKLNGKQALVFCRIRKLDSDFMRTARQRIFMERLIQACKKNPLRLLGLMAGDTLSYLQTDMTRAQMANLAAMAPLLLGYDLAEHTVPDGEDTYKNSTRQGASVITLDVEENARRLRKFIYEE